MAIRKISGNWIIFCISQATPGWLWLQLAIIIGPSLKGFFIGTNYSVHGQSSLDLFNNKVWCWISIQDTSIPDIDCQSDVICVKCGLLQQVINWDIQEGVQYTLLRLGVIEAPKVVNIRCPVTDPCQLGCFRRTISYWSRYLMETSITLSA